MFERSKKAASTLKRLIAVAAVPTLTVLALSLAPHPSDAYALYVVSDDDYVQVDELEGDVFLIDGSAELVSRKNGKDLLLTADQNVTVNYQDEPFSSVTKEETVTELLNRLDIHPSPLEMVSVFFQDGSLEINVASEFVFYEQDRKSTRLNSSHM